MSPGNASVIDGPYVMYRNDSILINYIDANGIKTVTKPAVQKEHIILSVNTDEPGKTFTVRLKSKLKNEKPQHGSVKKMLVISDIEGNFEAFRKILQANNVIDKDFNWTFDKGHLVLVGDFVDRGSMVTEVLWLIYALEEKAKAADGQVHFVLGNHEIMNMSGDLGYVHERYLQHAALMNTHYMKLYGPDSEIGRWLATKNIVERVGDMLFVHGGISTYTNYVQLPLEELNDMARPFYTDSTYKYPDVKQEILFSEYGPMWYRGYYKGNPESALRQIDSTLTIYKVRHIVTGHTIVADHVSSHYDGKLINIDVPHANGASEALLVDKDKFFRVNAKGERFPVEPLK